MSLHFFVAAYGKTYETFVAPFVYCAQKSNPGCSIEILLENPQTFVNTYKEILKFVDMDNVLLRKSSKDLIAKGLFKMEYGAYRFLEEPEIKKDQTYICDIDILHCEKILPKLIASWPKEVPYHNIIRKNQNKITGVMCVRSNDYYIYSWRNARDTILKGHRQNDEAQLTQLVNLVWTPLPLIYEYRPIFGLHLSPNRGPTKVIPNVTSKDYMQIIQEYIKETPKLFECISKELDLVVVQ